MRKPTSNGKHRTRARATATELVRRVLVATDGTPAADGAVRVAAALKAKGVEITSAAVLEPLAPYVADVGNLGMIPMLHPVEAERREWLLEAIREQRARVTAADWPVTVLSGWAAETIGHRAKSTRAQLILMGIGRHRPIDRLFGSETAVRVSRLAKAPILAVPTAANGLPRTIVAGVDFSRASVRAVEAAMRVAERNATLHLANVGLDLVRLAELESPDWLELYETGSKKMLDDFAEQLRARYPSATIRTARLKGRPSEELLRYAERVRADLVTVGAHRHGAIDRLVFGTVSAQLLRGSTCSVLVTPAAAPSPKRPSRRRSTAMSGARV